MPDTCTATALHADSDNGSAKYALPVELLNFIPPIGVPGTQDAFAIPFLPVFPFSIFISFLHTSLLSCCEATVAN